MVRTRPPRHGLGRLPFRLSSFGSWGVIALAGVLLAGCGDGSSEPSASVRAGSGDPAAAAVVAGTLVGNDRIEAPGDAEEIALVDASRSLFGSQSPMALWSADHQVVLYNSWRWESETEMAGRRPGDPVATPAIRVKDLARGTDTVLAEGAQTIAWRGEGPVAYTQADDPVWRMNERYVGHVVVRDSLSSPPQRWTDTSDRYIVLAWAGDHLLFHRVPPEREGGGELLAATGPGRIHSLGPDTTTLLGLSPDGRYAFVLTDSEGGRSLDGLRYGLVEVATGRSAGTVDVGAVPAGQVLGGALPLGAWDGDQVVIETSLFALDDGQVADGQPALAIFDWDPEGPALALSTVIPVDASVAPWAEEPYFTDDHRRVQAISIDRLPEPADPDQPPEPPEPFEPYYIVVDCEVATATCQAVPLDKPGAGHQLTPLRNPSRPSASDVEEEQ